MSTPLTAFYAGLLSLFYLLLAARIPLARVKYRVGIDDGGNHRLARLIRVHGNFSEYVPLALVLMLICELNGAANLLLHAVGVMLISGRLLHAYGLSRHSGSSVGRFTGTALTWTGIFLLAGWLLFTFLVGRQ